MGSSTLGECRCCKGSCGGGVDLVVLAGFSAGGKIQGPKLGDIQLSGLHKYLI